jgi:hypothetical protein
MRKNFLISGRSLLLWQFTRKDLKLTAIIIVGYHCYKIAASILLSDLSPYIDEMIGGRHCGCRRNRSTTGQIFCIHQILEKKWEYNETVHQLFKDFKKANDSVSEVLYNILSEGLSSAKLVDI